MTTPNIEELIDRLYDWHNTSAEQNRLDMQKAADLLQSQAERIAELEAKLKAADDIDTLLCKEIDTLRAQLAEIAATEPVAWRGRCTDPLHDWCLFYRRQESQEKFLNMEWQPLFTRPMPARPQDHEIRAQEPVLVVEKEPDYWSGGHFHEGSKPHIKPTKVWCLPIGTQLFIRPMPAQDVNAELVDAFEHHIEQTRPIERSTIALSKYKGAKQ